MEAADLKIQDFCLRPMKMSSQLAQAVVIEIALFLLAPLQAAHWFLALIFNSARSFPVAYFATIWLSTVGFVLAVHKKVSASLLIKLAPS